MKTLLKLLGIHVHEWSSWSAVSAGSLLAARTTRIVGKVIVQSRTRTTCGKTELNDQRVYF